MKHILVTLFIVSTLVFAVAAVNGQATETEINTEVNAWAPFAVELAEFAIDRDWEALAEFYNGAVAWNQLQDSFAQVIDNGNLTDIARANSAAQQGLLNDAAASTREAMGNIASLYQNLSEAAN